MSLFKLFNFYAYIEIILLHILPNDNIGYNVLSKAVR